MTRDYIVRALIFTVAILCWAAAPALAQAPLAGGLQIQLLPGYTHTPLQGIDSLVGKIAGKERAEIMYEIGPVPAKGAPLFGGSYTNQAVRLPKAEQLWLKEQTIGKQKFDIAYSKDQRLIVGAEFGKQGINLSAVAKTPAEVADVLLMALTLADAKAK